MPNTVSTPSALRHSMMASTALTGHNLLPGDSRVGKPSLAGLYEQPLGQSLVGPAAFAHLIGDRHDPPTFVALPARLVALEAVEDRRQRSELGQHGTNQEPE